MQAQELPTMADNAARKGWGKGVKGPNIDQDKYLPSPPTSDDEGGDDDKDNEQNTNDASMEREPERVNEQGQDDNNMEQPPQPVTNNDSSATTNNASANPPGEQVPQDTSNATCNNTSARPPDEPAPCDTSNVTSPTRDTSNVTSPARPDEQGHEYPPAAAAATLANMAALPAGAPVGAAEAVTQPGTGTGNVSELNQSTILDPLKMPMCPSPVEHGAVPGAFPDAAQAPVQETQANAHAPQPARGSPNPAPLRPAQPRADRGSTLAQAANPVLEDAIMAAVALPAAQANYAAGAIDVDATQANNNDSLVPVMYCLKDFGVDTEGGFEIGPARLPRPPHALDNNVLACYKPLPSKPAAN